MDLNWLAIGQKLLLGVTLAAPIGPVSVEMIKRGLRHGFLSAFSVRLGGALGNILCLMGAYFGLSQLFSHAWLLNTLGGIGALLLLYMGYMGFKKGIKDLDLDADIDVQNGLGWGFYLAIANPVALVFWPGIFAATMDPEVGVTLSGFFLNLFIILGVLLWGGGLSAALAFAHHKFTKNVIVRISQVAGLAMIYFGLTYLYTVAQRLF